MSLPWFLWIVNSFLRFFVGFYNLTQCHLLHALVRPLDLPSVFQTPCFVFFLKTFRLFGKTLFPTSSIICARFNYFTRKMEITPLKSPFFCSKIAWFVKMFSKYPVLFSFWKPLAHFGKPSQVRNFHPSKNTLFHLPYTMI